MLSKLRFFQSHDSTQLARLRGQVQPELCADQLGALPDRFRLIPGGTLNVAFEGVLNDGRPRCFKTHVTEMGRLGLHREAAILRALYGDRLDLRCIASSNRDWLVMHLLTPIEAAQRWTVTPEWISMGDVLAGIEVGQEIFDSFRDIVSASQAALAYLESLEKISVATKSRLQASLIDLHERVQNFGPQYCHGDLGPQNIMQDANGLILLDWEDMLLAFPGYDWIYWLSFFGNRDLLNDKALLRSGLPGRLCRDIIVAVLLVKSEISLRSGAAALHTVSIEDRLSTALNLSQ